MTCSIGRIYLHAATEGQDHVQHLTGLDVIGLQRLVVGELLAVVDELDLVYSDTLWGKGRRVRER